MGKKTDLESVHLVNHSKCMLAAFQNFRQDETMLDVTLVCEGAILKAHKLILSACSRLFKEMLTDNPCSHPIIMLRNYEFCDVKAVIDFVYKGELSVPRERLISALKVAEDLEIRGLRSSEPNKEKYEKLYHQVCGKLSGKKKRKRRRHNSSESENQYLNLSDSDQHFVESDDSLSANGKTPLSDSQPMDVESAEMEGNFANDKDVRPVVLRVGDPVLSNEESNSKNMLEDAEINEISHIDPNLSDADSQKETANSLKEAEDQTSEPVLEDVATSSNLDSFTVCSEKADILLKSEPETEQTTFEAEENIIECSEEQVGCISSSSLSPKPPDTQESDKTKIQDEGKRFICSKCDCVFTSRISFMKHKALGHNNSEKRSLYQCQHCTFSTEEFDSLKNHILSTHSDRVPYKCSVCSEEFSSNELYDQHLSVHESEKISLHDISSAPEQDLFSTQNRNPEKYVEFRCSICFGRFTSKLRCQIHEKTCEGEIVKHL